MQMLSRSDPPLGVAGERSDQAAWHLADLETRLRLADAERQAALARLHSMVLQRDVARAAAQRGNREAENRIRALEVQVQQHSSDAAHWREQYEELRARLRRVLRLSGISLAIRLVPRFLRQLIYVRMTGGGVRHGRDPDSSDA